MSKPKFEDDEFESTKDKPSTKAGATTVTRKPIENEAELDCDWNDESLQRKKDPLPRVRPEKGKAVRFAILPFIKPKRAFNHYIEKKGTLRCLSTDDGEGICCTSGQAGTSNLNIVALAVKYVNADPQTGKYDGKYKKVETEWELGHVNLSRTNNTDLQKLCEDNEDETTPSETVYDFDVIMTHNEATGIGYKLSRASRTPRWRKDSEMAAAIEEAAQPFLDGKILTARLGRKLSVMEWKVVLAGLSGKDTEEEDDEASSNADL